MWHDRNKVVLEEVDYELWPIFVFHSFEWTKNFLDDFHKAASETKKPGTGGNSTESMREASGGVVEGELIYDSQIRIA